VALENIASGVHPALAAEIQNLMKLPVLTCSKPWVRKR